MSAPNLDELEAELVTACAAYADAAKRAETADVEMTSALKRMNAAEAAIDARIGSLRNQVREARAHG